MTSQNPSAPLDHSTFYETLITRNKLVIDDPTQNALRSGCFLVAGCGSIGSSIVEPLVRIGVEDIRIAEPDPFELSNMNRQQARIKDCGVNKAHAVIDQVKEISPFVKFRVFEHGLTIANLEEALRGVAVVFDGVDVTTKGPIEIKYRMHEKAQQMGIPVISGYDIAGLQLLVVYRYDQPGVRPMFGKVKSADFARSMEPMDFLFKVIPIKCIPYEIFPAVRKMLAGEKIGFPQVVFTARSYGNMALVAALEILNRRPTKPYVIYDHYMAVRPWTERLRVSILRMVGLVSLLSSYFGQKK